MECKLFLFHQSKGRCQQPNPNPSLQLNPENTFSDVQCSVEENCLEDKTHPMMMYSIFHYAKYGASLDSGLSRRIRPFWELENSHKAAVQSRVYGRRSGGLCQTGWQCAWKMENEHKREILLRFWKSIFFCIFILCFLNTLQMEFLFLTFMCPLDPISNGTFSADQPCFPKSDIRSR